MTTAPPLPGVQTPGTVAPASVEIDNRALFAHFRDGRPMLWATLGNNISTTSGVGLELPISDGAGAFLVTPVINVGGWTAGTAGSLKAVVPIDGVYRVWASGSWQAVAVGRRELVVVGGAVTGASSVITPGTAAVPSYQLAGPALVYLTTGTAIGATGLQDSGSTITFTGHFGAEWVGSSAT